MDSKKQAETLGHSGDIPLLNAHQRQILGLLVDGLTFDEVAEKLDISKWTVYFHTRNARKVLGVRSVWELVYQARHDPDGLNALGINEQGHPLYASALSPDLSMLPQNETRRSA